MGSINRRNVWDHVGLTRQSPDTAHSLIVELSPRQSVDRLLRMPDYRLPPPSPLISTMPHLNHEWGNECDSPRVYGVDCGMLPENWCRRLWRLWKCDRLTPNTQYPKNRLEVLGFWGFGSHGLVVMKVIGTTGESCKF